MLWSLRGVGGTVTDRHSFFVDRDGEPDMGTLCVFIVCCTVAVTVFLIAIIAVVQVTLSPDHAVDLQDLGIGVAAIITACATFLGAYAGYVVADGSNKRATSAANATDQRTATAGAVEDERAGDAAVLTSGRSARPPKGGK